MSNSVVRFQVVNFRLNQYCALANSDLLHQDFLRIKREKQTCITKELNSLTRSENDPEMRAQVNKAQNEWQRFIEHVGLSRAAFKDNPRIFDALEGKRVTIDRIKAASALFSTEIHVGELSSVEKIELAATKLLKAREKALAKSNRVTEEILKLKASFLSVQQVLQQRQMQRAIELAARPVYLTLEDLRERFGNVDEMRLKKPIVASCREKYRESFSALEAFFKNAEKNTYSEKMKLALEEQSEAIFSEEGIKKIIFIYAIFEGSSELLNKVALEFGLHDSEDWNAFLKIKDALHCSNDMGAIYDQILFSEETESSLGSKFDKGLNQIAAQVSFYYEDLKVCDCEPLEEDAEVNVHLQNECYETKDSQTKSRFVFNVISEKIIFPMSNGELRTFQSYQEELESLAQDKKNKERVVDILVKMCLQYPESSDLYTSLAFAQNVVSFDFFYVFLEAGMFEEASHYIEKLGEQHRGFLQGTLLESDVFILQYPAIAIKYLSKLDGDELEEKCKDFVRLKIFNKDLSQPAAEQFLECLLTSENIEGVRQTMTRIAQMKQLDLEAHYIDCIDRHLIKTELNKVFMLINAYPLKKSLRKICEGVLEKFDISKLTSMEHFKLALLLITYSRLSSKFTLQERVALSFQFYNTLSKKRAKTLVNAIGRMDKENSRFLHSLNAFLYRNSLVVKTGKIKGITMALKGSFLAKSKSCIEGLAIFYSVHKKGKFKTNVLESILRMVTSVEKQEILSRLGNKLDKSLKTKRANNIRSMFVN